MKPRVISYTRFSSSRQAKGDSYRRQTQLALDWCHEHGYELDESTHYKDLGVSGFTGDNLQTGALSILLLHAQDGTIPKGTILLVENFDRLSRLPVMTAITILQKLMEAGITLVTLQDNNVWTSERLNDLGSFILAVVTMYKGYAESEQKAKRIRSAYAAARAVGSQKSFGAAPGWLSRVDQTSPWVVDEAKAESVRKVFEFAALGYGSKMISKLANTEGWPVPTRLNLTEGRWHGQMPGVLLRSRTVLGEHTHRLTTHEARRTVHWKGRPDGAPIVGYYPQIISEDLWYRARASVETRLTAKRRGDHYFNFFSGLMYCGHCGAPTQRKIDYVSRTRGQLVCSDRIAGFTTCPSSPCLPVDYTLVRDIVLLAPAAFAPGEREQMQNDLTTLQGKLDDLAGAKARVVEAIAATGGAMIELIDKARDLTAQGESLLVQIESIRGTLSEVGSMYDESSAERFGPHLYSTDAHSRDLRVELQLKLSKVVECIWLYPYELAVVKFKGSRECLNVFFPPKNDKTPQPHLAKSIAGTLVHPTPQIRNNFAKKS